MTTLSTALKTLLFVSLVFLIIVNMKQGRSHVRVKSTVDGRTYKVLARHDDLQAANMLAKLNANLTAIITHVYALYPKDKDIITLFDRYKPESLEEGAFDTDNTSYSINKGERIVVCLRQSNGDFVDMNTLMYVAIHELAHVMTPTVGHDKSFWANMQRLVKHATDTKSYEYVNYSQKPAKYCGINITSSVT